VFVSDDDSSSHAALKHTLEARMTLENLMEPPCGPDGKKLKDAGKLPAEMKEPTTFLVDPSPCCHVYGSYFYCLIACCHELYKMIVKYSFVTLLCNETKPWKTYGCLFEMEMNAGLYHQFNDHVHCSREWCKYVHIPKELWNKVNENNNNKLCNKEFNELIWNEAKSIHDLFVTNENHEILNHEFDSQKNEALNKAFTKVAP